MDFRQNFERNIQLPPLESEERKVSVRPYSILLPKLRVPNPDKDPNESVSATSALRVALTEGGL